MRVVPNAELSKAAAAASSFLSAIAAALRAFSSSASPSACFFAFSFSFCNSRFPNDRGNSGGQRKICNFSQTNGETTGNPE